MSVRHALLALLCEAPKYGLQLREEFEAGTGEVWPLNVGQVYMTLQRLERDGLIESDAEAGDGPKKTYRLTEAGRDELMAWLGPPPDTGVPPRDELVIKVLVALRVPGVDVSELVQAHRIRLVVMMQHFTAVKAEADPGDVGLLLVVDAEIFRLDAVIRWLDGAEARSARCRTARVPRHVCASAGTAAAASGGGAVTRGVGDGRREQVVRRRRDVGARPRRRRPDGGGGRVGGGDGPERFGQEHAVDDRRDAGGADVGRRASRWDRHGGHVVERSGAASSSFDRLRLPVVQPSRRG